MSKIADLHKEWSRDPEYQQACDRLGAEFELTRALIEARTGAGFTQAELAGRMETTQSVVARLESGRVPDTEHFAAPEKSLLYSYFFTRYEIGSMDALHPMEPVAGRVACPVSPCESGTIGESPRSCPTAFWIWRAKRSHRR